MRDGKSYCLNCFDAMFAEYCVSCAEPIGVDQGQMSHHKLHWHATDQCFACVTCRCSLLGRPFLPRNNSIYCSIACCKQEQKNASSHLEKSQQLTKQVAFDLGENGIERESFVDTTSSEKTLNVVSDSENCKELSCLVNEEVSSNPNIDINISKDMPDISVFDTPSLIFSETSITVPKPAPLKKEVRFEDQNNIVYSDTSTSRKRNKPNRRLKGRRRRYGTECARKEKSLGHAAVMSKRNDDSDSSSICSTCSSSSSSNDERMYELPSQRTYLGSRVNYVPNDTLACVKRNRQKQEFDKDPKNCVIS